MNNKYEVVVVGGGHAGIEAALASVRMSCKTLLIDIKPSDIGEMSCNPAIGGVGKGQLVKEIDALGGLMGLAADHAGIQFKILNESKGAAVRSSRAQCDRRLYKQFVQKFLKSKIELDIIKGSVCGFKTKGDKIRSILLEDGTVIETQTAIFTPGTFLNGIMHLGLKSFEGGRIGAKNSRDLSVYLREYGFNMLRFKTGTCARIDGKTIDFSELARQDGDTPPQPFSWVTQSISNPQLPCYITHTNEKTHEIIRSAFDRSPMMTGQISGTSVRYCPSIEDKLVKFPEHRSHHVFLEPEGLDTDQYYPNGTFTSMPEDIQEAFLRSIPGLENVKINKYGYAIEHDVLEPTQLYDTLESKAVENLFFAGQINGTTGYEEAGAQGLVAGINASAKVKGLKPFILKRHEAYIAVMIDDLIAKGTKEPYRMFTSRAEYRLLLREDNAHLRLSPIAYEYGLITKDFYDQVELFRDMVEKGKIQLQTLKITEDSALADKLNITKSIKVYDLLKRPNAKWQEVFSEIDEVDFDIKTAQEIDIQVKYAGYIKRQENDIIKMKKMENTDLPRNIEFTLIKGLSKEEIEKLTEIRPRTLGQASRVSGVTPAAITSIMLYMKINKLL